MKKIATIASAVALTATSLSASAWWGCNPCAMTEEQQQAMAQQQTKAREQMMAAQRWMAEQMAAQRAEMTKRMQAQGVDPMTMGFPGTMGPEGTRDPWWGTAGPWDDMGMPEYPTMPPMPEPPSMPAIPGSFSMEMPQPPVPTFMRDRYAELEAHRSRIMQESKTRRDKTIKEIAERRREIEANRPTHPHRYGRSVRSPYLRMTTTPEVPASTPQTTPAVKAPTQVGGTAPAPEATPTPVTATTQAPVAPAVPVAPVPTPETTPVAPAPATATP